MLIFIWNLASFVIALGILVTVHEYGHFWVARKNGVKVERFSVGFGKPIWRKKDALGTEFVIALIPLGGYVKMLDERVDDVQPEDKDKTFNVKNVYQRIAIIAAGPLANFVFAIFAFYVMFLIGTPSIKPIIGLNVPNSIAAQADLPYQAEIKSVAGVAVKDWNDVNLAIVGQIGEPALVVTAQLHETLFEKEYWLDLSNWHVEPDKQSPLTSIGIVPYMPNVKPIVTQIQPDSAAARSGMHLEDKIVALNGQAITDWQSFSTQLKELPEQLVNIEVERMIAGKIQKVDLAVTLGSKLIADKKVGYLGISPQREPYPEKYQFDLAYGPIDSIGQAVNKTWQLVVLSFDMIGKLITGDVSVKNLSGPISIAQGAGNSAGYGLVYFLGFLALISINLGIINLLPLPVLDGGHLLYYLIELLTGKPVPEKVQELGFRFGAIALLGLMSIAIINDLSRL